MRIWPSLQGWGDMRQEVKEYQEKSSYCSLGKVSFSCGTQKERTGDHNLVIFLLAGFDSYSSWERQKASVKCHSCRSSSSEPRGALAGNWGQWRGFRCDQNRECPWQCIRNCQINWRGYVFLEVTEEEFKLSFRHKIQKMKEATLSSQRSAYWFSKTTTTLSLSSLTAPSSTKISKKLEVQSWATEQHCSVQKHRACARHKGRCEFKMPQAEEATQLSFLLSLLTKGKRKADYKHHLLLQQFVELTHLPYALFMSEWKHLDLCQLECLNDEKNWQISIFHFGHTNT